MADWILFVKMTFRLTEISIPATFVPSLVVQAEQDGEFSATLS